MKGRAGPAWQRSSRGIPHSLNDPNQLFKTCSVSQRRDSCPWRSSCCGAVLVPWPEHVTALGLGRVARGPCHPGGCPASLPWVWVCPAPASLPRQGLAVPWQSWVFMPEQGPDATYAELCSAGKRVWDCSMRGDRTQTPPGAAAELWGGQDPAVAPCSREGTSSKCHGHSASAMDRVSVPWAECECHGQSVSAMGAV